jgi:hypothetical protein
MLLANFEFANQMNKLAHSAIVPYVGATKRFVPVGAAPKQKRDRVIDAFRATISIA